MQIISLLTDLLMNDDEILEAYARLVCLSLAGHSTQLLAEVQP